MALQPNEIRDITRLLEQGKPLPDKYRFLLFGDKREVELVWNGKTDEVTNVVLPFQTIEQIDEPREEGLVKANLSLFDTSGRQVKGWTNKLIWGDNKLVLSALKNGPMRREIEEAGGLKLIYIDPPFDVGADFSMNIEIGDEEFTKKPSVIEEVAYRDTWGKGADSFIAMIYERLKLMHGLLADDGSIYVHCDYRLSADIRLVLDEVFGKGSFVNEIILQKDAGQRVDNFFPRKHDTIFFFSKTKDQFIFNDKAKSLRTAYNETAVKMHFKKTDENGRRYREYPNGKRFFLDDGKLIDDVWTDISGQEATSPIMPQYTGYPTQKAESLIERIVQASSNKGDLIADFFMGSGTTLAVAEKLGRKWIGTDLGRFGVHTARKRMIEVQRQLKKEGKNYRAFEILNLGKYERKQFTHVEGDLRAEEQERVRQKKEDDFKTLVLSAYKAEPINNFRNFIGKKRDRLVAVGPIEYPVSHSFVSAIIEECREKGVTKADVLGFDYEMGIDFSDAKQVGIDLQFKIIPNEVFDKRAVERGQVKFFDVAFIEAKPIIKGHTVAIELTSFSVFYNQDDIVDIEENMKAGAAKIVLENGNIIKLSKDKQSDIITREVITQKWSDWIDYWAVDFDYESKKEVVRVPKKPVAQVKLDGSQDAAQGSLLDYEEEWTGQYVFENEWQTFRTRKNRDLGLTSVFKEVGKGRRKVAIKVIDIFGNDTTKVIEINV